MWIAPSIGSQRRRERRKEKGEGERERRNDASQRELRHLQCVVSVCVCVHTTVCVCVSHICFKNMAALGLKMAAPPAVALPGAICGENPKKRKAVAIYQK